MKFARDSHMLIDGVVVSSNITLGDPRPRDPGIAIWFTWDHQQVCIPCDRYFTAEENLQAVFHILEARRVELRHGTLALVRASFKGFMLAAPTERPWWQVLGVSERATIDEIRAAYRKRVAVAHPDRAGGNQELMSQINRAWEQAQYIGQPQYVEA